MEAKNESLSENVVLIEHPERVIETPKAEQAPKVLELTADQINLGSTRVKRNQSVSNKEVSLPNSQIEGAAKETESIVQQESEVQPLLSEIRASDYYAQLGAFSTEQSAQVWRRIRVSYLPKTLIVQKRRGLWAVVSGPYSSTEIAKQAFVDTEIEPYMVRGSDLKIETDQARGRL